MKKLVVVMFVFVLALSFSVNAQTIIRDAESVFGDNIRVNGNVWFNGTLQNGDVPWTLITGAPSFITSGDLAVLSYVNSTTLNNALSNYYTKSQIDGEGFLTTESDPLYVASPAYTISNSMISNWNLAHGWGNHAAAGYLTSSSLNDYYTKADSDNRFINPSSSSVTVLGDWVFKNDVVMEKDLIVLGQIKNVSVTDMDVTGDIVPEFNGVFSLGSASSAWQNVYADNLYGAVAWSQITGAPSFLTSETDPVFTSSPAFSVSSNDILNWDSAHGWGNHAAAGYLTSAALSPYLTESQIEQLLIDMNIVNGTDGADGREVMLNVNASHIIWKYEDESNWNALILLEDLRGADGADGVDGTSFDVSGAYLYDNGSNVIFFNESALPDSLDNYNCLDDEVLLYYGGEWTCSEINFSESDPVFIQWLSNNDPVLEELDPVFINSSAYNINDSLISDWNTAFSWGDHASAGYLDGYNLDYVDFNTSFVSTSSTGRLSWNDFAGTLNLGLNGSDVELQLGQELVQRVNNDDVVPINNGDLVYVHNSNNDRAEVMIASCDVEYESYVFGMATEDIGVGELGYITNYGLVRGLDTQSYPYGTALWLGLNGEFTDVRPTSTCHSIFIGHVVKQNDTDGTILLDINFIPALTSLSDVIAPLNMTNGMFPVWNETGFVFDDVNNYLMSETDPVFINSTAYDINETNTTNWNTAYDWGDHASMSYALSSEIPTSLPAENITMPGDCIYLPDCPNVRDAIGILARQNSELWSSGWVSGGEFSGSGLNITVANGTGYVRDGIILKRIEWNETNLTLNYGDNFIEVNSNGNVITSPTKPTPDVIYLGYSYISSSGVGLKSFEPLRGIDADYYQNNLLMNGVGALIEEGVDMSIDNLTGLYIGSGHVLTSNNEYDVGGFDEFIQYYRNNSVWVYNGVHTNLDVNYYNDVVSGTLVPVPDGNFTKHFVLLDYVNNQGFFIYGTELYDSLEEAEAGSLPMIPDAIERFSVNLVSIIGTNNTNIEYLYDIRPSFDRLFSASTLGSVGGTTTSHSSLSDLTHDDHPQYLLIDGTRSMNGNLDLGNNNILNANTITASLLQGSLDWSYITNPPNFTTLETDPVFTNSSAYNITDTNITNWNTAYDWGDHASMSYVNTTLIEESAGDVNISADVNIGDCITFPSGGKICSPAGSTCTIVYSPDGGTSAEICN